MSRMKKIFQKIIYVIDDALPLVLTAFAMLCACCVGYMMGAIDGYTEGYINGTTNQYTQNPENNLFQSALQSGKVLSKNISYHVEELFDKSETQKNTVSVQILYEDNAPNISSELYDALAMIPQSLLTNFVRDEWKIVVQPVIPTIQYKGSDFSAAGLTQYPEKTVRLEANAKIAKDLVLHEFGHYFDARYDSEERLSYTEEWNEVYKTESRGVYQLTRNFHNVDTATEYFAEIFAWYVEKPELIQELCPESCALMQNYISNSQ